MRYPFFRMLQSSLNFIDMYGSRIEINFQKKSYVKTVFGGVLTLLIFMLFGLGVWFFGKELIERKNPAVITSQRPVVKARRVDINSNELIIMAGIANFNSQPFVDDSIYTMKAYQESLVYYNDTQSGKQLKKLEMFEKKVKYCDESDIGISDLTDYFKKLNLPKLHCFAKQEIFMEGDFDADAFSQVYFYAEKCNNATSKVVCQPPEVIEKTLQKTKIQFFISDRIVDPLNFDSPFINKGINQYALTSPTFPKEVQIFFTNQYIQSDVGVLNQDIQEQSGHIFTELKEMAFFNDPNVLVRVQFRLQKQKENLMQRRYNKLADVIAQIGGLLKILTTFGGLICYPISKFVLNKAIVDEIFNFNTSDKKDSEKSSPTGQNQQQNTIKQVKSIREQINSKISKQNQNSAQNINDINQKDTDFETAKQQRTRRNTDLKKSQFEPKENVSMTNTEKKQKSILDKAKNIFQVYKNTITFKFTDIFSHVYMKSVSQKKENHSLIQEGIEKLYSHLDILFILNKIHEIEKLKNILLNSDQLKLFEFIPKPVISNNSINDRSIDNPRKDSQFKSNLADPIDEVKVYTVFNKTKSEEEKAIDAYESLVGIINKQKRTKVDLKLIQLIDPSILKQVYNKDEKLNIYDSTMENLSQLGQIVKKEKNKNLHFINVCESPKLIQTPSNPLQLESQDSNQIDDNQQDHIKQDSKEESDVDCRSLYFAQDTESVCSNQNEKGPQD